MVRTRLVPVALVGIAAVFTLSACGGGTGTETQPSAGTGSSGAASAPASPASSAPGASAPASSAPASSARASSGAAAKPSTPATQLAVTGNVAGLDFKAVGDAEKEQAGGLQQAAKGAKIEPANCQKITQYATATNAKDTGASVAVSGQTAYGTGVAPTSLSLKEMKAAYQACPRMTMDLNGQKVPMEVEVADVNVPGASDAFSISQTMDVMGQKVTNHTVNGLVRGLLVTSFASGQGADPAKVSEVFKAQAARVTSAK